MIRRFLLPSSFSLMMIDILEFEPRGRRRLRDDRPGDVYYFATDFLSTRSTNFRLMTRSISIVVSSSFSRTVA